MQLPNWVGRIEAQRGIFAPTLLARVCQQSDDLTALPTEVCPTMALQRHSPAVPEAELRPVVVRSHKSALIQSLPACGCKAMFRVAIPSQSKRALCHRVQQPDHTCQRRSG